MRILLDYRPALRRRTGVGEYAHELTRALVATSPGPAEALCLFSATWKDRLDPNVVPGASVIDRRVPNRVLNFCWHRLGWPSAETLAGGPFTVVHAFHPLLIPSSAAAQVVTVHDLAFLDHPERTAREIRRDYPTLAPRHVPRADHVVVNSNATAAEVCARLGVAASRITVCTPGAPDWAPRTQEPAAGCVLFLGTIEARKNLGVLFDAYERLLTTTANVPPLVIAGRPTDAAAGLIARSTQPPLAGHVEFPGYLDDAAREALYRRALIFVMPSHTEGFGMPVLEAMTVGVPVVFANRGALPEVAGEAGRAFEPDDGAGLAAALAALLGSASTRQAMREAGWRRARLYDWGESARRLRSAWAQAIDARRGRRG